MAKIAARDLQKEAAWRRRLGSQAESGQSVRAWCRQHRVTETAFYWWRKELARRDAEPLRSPRRAAGQRPAARRSVEDAAASFVPVHVADEPGRAGDGVIEIVLTDGRRVRVTGAVHQPLLRMVLDTLAAADAGAAEQRAC